MPKVKITKAAVEQIPHPEKGQVIFCDTEMNGFYLIVGKLSKTFVAQRDMNGKAVRYTIGRYGRFTVEEARKIAKEKLYMMSLGINPNMALLQKSQRRLISKKFNGFLLI